jgi:hypothetical protein
MTLKPRLRTADTHPGKSNSTYFTRQRSFRSAQTGTGKTAAFAILFAKSFRQATI